MIRDNIYVPGVSVECMAGCPGERWKRGTAVFVLFTLARHWAEKEQQQLAGHGESDSPSPSPPPPSGSSLETLVCPDVLGQVALNAQTIVWMFLTPFSLCVCV